MTANHKPSWITMFVHMVCWSVVSQSPAWAAHLEQTTTSGVKGSSCLNSTKRHYSSVENKSWS